ncbi:MAG: hypothetical protein H7338_20685 [Candidatus Sericytochromatia bacterium]|nr:hypothetical protein [Candidatus Sericytochromatia bacterium]
MLLASRTLLAATLVLAACAPLPLQAGRDGIVPIELGSALKPGLQTGFRTQAYDVADVYNANVSVTGPGMASPVNATGNPIAMPNGQGSAVAQVVVPTGNNRVITAAGLNTAGGALASWITVKGVTNVAAGVNPAVSVNWTTTPTARVIEALIAAGSPFAATVNAAQIQTLVNQITVPVGGGASFTVHPSRVDATVIANAIIAAGGSVPGSPPSGSTISAGTISGTIAGLVLNQTASVVANDPGSAPVTTNTSGAYTISGVTPGAGIAVRATTFFTDDVTTTTTVSPGGNGPASATLAPLHYVTRSLYSNGPIANAVMRWSRMPIQILIVQPSNPAGIGWNTDHKTAFAEALARWTNQLGDLISFNVTTVFDNDGSLAAKKAASDIWVDWVNNFGDGRLGYAQAQFSYCGSCSPMSNDLAVHIQLGITTTAGPLPDYSYRGVATHELGHALGSLGNASTNGHSDLETDNMYFSTDPYFPINLIPVLRDYKTMRLLYSSPADITRS